MKGILETIGAAEFADCVISEPIVEEDADEAVGNGADSVGNGADSSVNGECSAQEDNDDGWCDRYISRLPDGLKTCDCYDFCNGELIGCLAKGEEPNEYEDCPFLRLGCTADQKAPPGFSVSAALKIRRAGFGLFAVVVMALVSL